MFLTPEKLNVQNQHESRDTRFCFRHRVITVFHDNNYMNSTINSNRMQDPAAKKRTSEWFKWMNGRILCCDPTDEEIVHLKGKQYLANLCRSRLLCLPAQRELNRHPVRKSWGNGLQWNTVHRPPTMKFLHIYMLLQLLSASLYNNYMHTL